MARDRSLEHKHLGIHHPPGLKDAQILEEVGPQGDEIVITKTCGGVFNGSNIEYVLRNLGIQHLDRGRRGDQRVRGGRGARRGGPQLPGPRSSRTPRRRGPTTMHRAAMRAMDEIYAKVAADERDAGAPGSADRRRGRGSRTPVRRRRGRGRT